MHRSLRFCLGVLLDSVQVRKRNQIVVTISPQLANVAAPLADPPLPQTTDWIAERDWGLVFSGLVVISGLLGHVLVRRAFNEKPAVTPGKPIVIQAMYDVRGVLAKTARLILDRRDVTLWATVSTTSISYVADLGTGQHIALIELKGTAGNSANRTWRFTVTAVITTPTATVLPPTTALPTATSAPTATPVPTATPIPPSAFPDLGGTDISLGQTKYYM